MLDLNKSLNWNPSEKSNNDDVNWSRSILCTSTFEATLVLSNLFTFYFLINEKRYNRRFKKYGIIDVVKYKIEMLRN